jgi:hypothetical protein
LQAEERIDAGVDAAVQSVGGQISGTRARAIFVTITRVEVRAPGPGLILTPARDQYTKRV